jgi:hypothetical protein
VRKWSPRGRGENASIGAGERGSSAARPVDHVVSALGAHIIRKAPAHRIEGPVLDGHHASVLYRDQGCSFGARLAHVAPLQVAAEDDVRFGGQHFTMMDVAERPVVVTFGDEHR